MATETTTVTELSPEAKEQVVEIVKTRLTEDYLKANKIDDAAIHRFCIARSYDPDASCTMLSNYITWRKDNGIDDLTKDHPKVVKEASTKKAYFLGYTKTKQPLVLVHGGGHDPVWSPVEDVKTYALYMLETAIAHMPPGVDKLTLISDYSSFGMDNMDNGLLQEGAHLLQSYYPERVGDIYLVNYPVILWGIWKVVSLWVDEKTRNKFHFVSDLAEILALADPAIIPDFLGGNFVDHMPEDNLSGIQRLAVPPQ